MNPISGSPDVSIRPLEILIMKISGATTNPASSTSREACLVSQIYGIIFHRHSNGNLEKNRRRPIFSVVLIRTASTWQINLPLKPPHDKLTVLEAVVRFQLFYFEARNLACLEQVCRSKKPENRWNG